MSKFILPVLRKYVRVVGGVNRAVGEFSLWLLLAMLGVLVWSMFANNVLNSPSIWVMEMSQFLMAAYCLLGAGFSLQQGTHVRMDFLYERWKPRKRAFVDSLTSVFLLFYLGVLVFGGWESSSYAIEYEQHNHTVWAPPLAPVKILMTIGMALMLLQALAELAKDVVSAVGGNGAELEAQ
jgi:TRAP-type mannitol/chloroaromatic compound transport system permease small subunit